MILDQQGRTVECKAQSPQSYLPGTYIVKNPRAIRTVLYRPPETHSVVQGSIRAQLHPRQVLEPQYTTFLDVSQPTLYLSSQTHILPRATQDQHLHVSPFLPSHPKMNPLSLRHLYLSSSPSLLLFPDVVPGLSHAPKVLCSLASASLS